MASCAVALALGAGCAPQADDAATARLTPAASAAIVPESTPRPPGYVVDSAIPISESLRRFREGVAPVTRLAGGPPSRDQLVARFVRAVERGDTAALAGLEIGRADFAYLFYPWSIYTRPPFQERPDIVWMLQRAGGGSGFRRLVQRYGGRPLGYAGYRCDEAPRHQGPNRLWGGCVITYCSATGEQVTGRLFGAILERGGRFKFISYANDL